MNGERFKGGISLAKVTVPDHGSFDVEEGTKLTLALEDNGVQVLHRCGGKAKCTTCRVEVMNREFGDLTEIEQEDIQEKRCRRKPTSLLSSSR